MRAGLATLVALLLFLPAAARAADPTFEAALSPERVTFGEPAPDARLTVQTGEEAETFWFTGSGTVEGYTDLDGRNAGFGLLSASCGTEARIEGAGTLGGSACAVPALAACNRTRLPAFHGGFGGASFEVTIPPRTRSVLVLPLAHARTAPWTNSRYGASFFLSGGTLDASRTVTGPVTGPAGRTGVRISLSLEPAADGPCRPPRRIRGPVTVRGRTDPNLAGQEVVLRTARDSSSQPDDLARLRVAGDGTFAFAGWRPAPGYQEVGARYVSQRPELVDDFSAPLAFEIEPEPTPTATPTPTPTTTQAPVPSPGPRVTTPAPVFPVILANRRLRADRRGVVRLRLLCPAAASRPCTERVRISGGGRVVATRSVTLVPGRAQTVRVRLTPAARRSLARRRRALAVLVRIGAAEAVRATLSRRDAR